VARLLLVLYAIGTPVVAIPLAFGLGHAGELADTTSGKVLAAALLALGFGALMAARDPWRHRLTVQVLIVFSALATLAIVYRVAFEDHPHDPAWVLLPFAAAAPVLLTFFYPRRPTG
jgi:hypothetical protein